MRKYMLASAADRPTVDLRDYESIITEAVHEVMPKAAVQVEQDCYYVSPTPSKGDAIRIGRQICQSKLKYFCIQIPKLFSSSEIEEETANGTKQKHNGGHH